MLGCPLYVPPTFFEKYLSENMLQKYKYFYEKSFIDLQTNAKWCPNPKCSYAI